MNWAYLWHCPWLDTHARFVADTPPAGALLDLGSSDGETLGHIAELRPGLRLFAAAYPLLAALPSSRKKFTARIHWLGWSAYLLACQPS